MLYEFPNGPSTLVSASLVPQEMENLTLGRFGKRPTYGVTAEDMVGKKKSRGEERRVAK